MVKYRDISLMLDAMGEHTRRSMLARLRKGGAMSLSKLGEPYKISLPATFKHVRILEDSGLVTTEKKGRVRICIYNPVAFKELASELACQAAFWEASFGRLEKHISNAKKKK